MGILYKAYQNACYKALDKAWEKGRDVAKARKYYDEDEINSTIFDFNFRQICTGCINKGTRACNSCKKAVVFNGEDNNYKKKWWR